jgi:hypothetical protein
MVLLSKLLAPKKQLALLFAPEDHAAPFGAFRLAEDYDALIASRNSK